MAHLSAVCKYCVVLINESSIKIAEVLVESLPQFKFAPVHIGFIFPRSSEHAELRRQFNSVLDQLSQSGLLDKEFTTLGDKVGGT